MKVVVRGDRNKNSNLANGGFPFFWYSAFFVLIGSLFFGIGIYLIIEEEPFFSSDTELIFLCLLSTILGGIAIVVGIYSFIKRPKITNNVDLMKSEVCVKLPVVCVEEANSSMNGIDGYYIECRNLNNEIGCLDIYKSDVIYNVNCLSLEPGDLVPVYVDWRNPANFYMDIDAYEKADNTEKMSDAESEYL